jgi:hypothetical protein
MFYKRILVLVLIGFHLPSPILAQDEISNSSTNELWTGITLKYKLNKRYSFNLKQQVRVSDNWSSIRTNFYEVAAKYKIDKHFSIKAHYRYTIRNEDRNVHRYSLDGNTNWRIKPTKLTFKYRFRFQYSAVEFTGQPFTFLRNKFGLEYSVSKKFKPYLSYESFFKFGETNKFRVNRYTIGFSWAMDKRMNLDVYYRIDQEINSNHRQRQNILALLLSYQIK